MFFERTGWVVRMARFHQYPNAVSGA